ncbi:uncharacterized protein [Palaemon carinicauda]|uniref:uncharacterized protein n=1 Tax=Palaemon carinicauda TaxID=392227 RepID=UPI0035B61D7C
MSLQTTLETMASDRKNQVMFMEEGNNKGLVSEDSSRNEVKVYKTVVMRQVPRCEKFNEYSNRDECGETGHRISECKKEKVAKCYGCGMTGHIASGCRSDHTNVNCGNCGQNGHYARMCQEQRAKCTVCGVDGQIARVCRKKGLSLPGYLGN